jgi:tetratricopeptide (TPR) repeat protein
MAQDKMYKAALEAIDQGQSARARDLFTRLLRSDSSKAEYWLWMSTLVDTNQERIYCLESALRANPDNEAAKRGLIILGARQADKDVTPAPPIRRNWEKDLENVVEPHKSIFHRIWDNRNLRIAIISVPALIIVGLIIGSINSLHPQAEPLVVIKVSPFPTRTPEPTLSPTATRTLVIRSPTPTFLGPTPLWMFLSATYTPFPLYVNTPHPVIEAYRSGIRAYERSDWTSMLGFMQQAIAIEPNSPDFFYYLAEAYRLMGNYQDAVLAYGKAIKINPQFAPAYLGRALAYEKINPKSDIEGELNYALQYDPNYVDAYLTRARIRIEHNNPQAAQDDILTVDKLFPNHPMVYVLLAQTYLELNDQAAALKNALIGLNLDKTSLPAYLTLARVYLANHDLPQTLNYVNIYLAYVVDDANGWAVKAQAEYLLGNINEALAACTQGITADAENAPSWYYCGLIHLDQGDSRTAVNDLVSAVNLDMLDFDYSVALGKALWVDDRLTMAARQFNSAELLAITDSQLAVIYYNRAQIYEKSLSMSKAMQDWKLLLALPADQVPEDWRIFAQEHLNIINPPTPTITPTRTPIPTQTITLTPTPNPTETSTPTQVPFPTIITTITNLQTPIPINTRTPIPFPFK